MFAKRRQQAMACATSGCARTRCAKIFGLLLLGAMTLGMAGLSGCSESAEDFSTKDGFADHLLANCLRKESHFNPRPMYLHTLKGITGEPKSVSEVDESTQKWQFDFEDGSMDVFVVLEPGASWVAEYPKVFVDVHRSGLLR